MKNQPKKKIIAAILACVLVAIGIHACRKDRAQLTNTLCLRCNITPITETVNGITYRLFKPVATNAYKGILVMGSGNDENNPSPGDLNGAEETDLCTKAATHDYLAAIVQYRKTPGNADWNASAMQIGQDYDKCITTLSTKYKVDKTKSVVGGVSYASFMLLTDIALNNTLSYCKGLLAPCGSADEWKAANFKIPVYSVVCSGNNEGGLAGTALYNAITNPAIKTKSEGVTDNSCSTHCGGNWTDQLYNKMNSWLQ